MPAGAEVTVPEPVPVRATVRLNWGVGVKLKFAVQVEFALRTIDDVLAVPAQLPDQPVNVDPVAGAALSVIEVFCA